MKLICETYPKLKVLTPAGTAQFKNGLFETDNAELASHVGALDYVLMLAEEPVEAVEEPVEAVEEPIEEPAEEPVDAGTARHAPTVGKKANKVDD